MKTRMQRFLARHVIAVSACATACAGLGQLGPRPDALSGQWVDIAKTTVTDSSVWILAPNGQDRLLRIRVRRDTLGHVTVDRRIRSYALWYLSGDLADSAARALCVNRRPGREAGSCMRFTLDTLPPDSISAVPRRRLTLRGYRGQHHVAERVLIERR